MSRARWIVLILVSVAGVSAAGCGGGGSARVSAAELVQKADAICATENARFNRVQAHSPPNASVAADQTDELIKVTQDANSHLRELKPPEGLQSAYDRYLDARDRVIDQMNRGMDAARNQDSAEYGAAQAAVARASPQRMKLAEAVGLKVCSSSRASA